MQKYPVIILAAGLGTRLQSAVPDLPKCLAPINGVPFLHYVIEHFKSQGIEEFIFSLAYKHEMIEDWLRTALPSDQYTCSIQDTPMGTGGDLRRACTLTNAQTVLVTNGDTLFRVDFKKLLSEHFAMNADCTFALKPMTNIERYETVQCADDGQITNFLEKQKLEAGLINGGVYVLNTQQFLREDFPKVFSLETDYFQKYYHTQRMVGVVQDEYFIDIGTPEDYQRAQIELV